MLCHADVACLHYVTVFNAAFCMNDMQFVNAGRGCKRQPYGRIGLMTALQVAMSVSLCLRHPVALSDFIICRGLCVCIQSAISCLDLV